MNAKDLYRRFLKSDFWKELSAEQRRLHPNCKNCGTGEGLQAHHWRYPKKWTDTTLEDLETLCEECHRLQHGLWVNFEIDSVFKRINKAINWSQRPEKSDWLLLKKEPKCEFIAEHLASTMFIYSILVLNKDRRFAMNIRNSILSRFPEWAHLAKNSEWRQAIERSQQVAA